MKSRKPSTPSLFDDPLLSIGAGLSVVHARFQDQVYASFDELIAGYQSLKVLTYSNSVSLVNRAAAAVDDIEIIFGREDIVAGMGPYLHYQELLIRDLIEETKGQDLVRQKIDAGKLRLYVVRDILSHEKLFLLEGKNGTRVITGSANFSERAFSGLQNESYICFDDDEAAWNYFNRKYEQIKEQSTVRITKQAILADEFELEYLPTFGPQQADTLAPRILLVPDRPPEPTIVNKIVAPRTPKHYSGLSGVIATAKGIATIDRATARHAIQYIRSNARTEDDAAGESLSIDIALGTVRFGDQFLSLEAEPAAVRSDVEFWLAYFDGYDHFRGDTAKMSRDYFTFMSWFYLSPLLCDLRNRALAGDEHVHDFPIFGVLYGKSNCGKSELVRTLLRSMFDREGFLQNDWFTKTQVARLREQNKRFPMVFDDLDGTRFSNHAVALIKEDFLSLKEYPAVVLSMNGEKDTFENEVRKRCLIVYTGASLPDHTDESRELGSTIRRLKRGLSTALYREYLRRALARLQQEFPTDILEFSSSLLTELFAEYSARPLPAWCRSTSMGEYSQSKHDKIKDELLQLLEHQRSSWSTKGNKIFLRLEDVHSSRKLLKDIPDYLVSTGSRGDVIILLREELEEFLGTSIAAPGRIQRFLTGRFKQ